MDQPDVFCVCVLNELILESAVNWGLGRRPCFGSWMGACGLFDAGTHPPVGYVCELSHFSRSWLCNPTDCSPPGSSVHGILQARILEWAVIPPPGDHPNPEMEPEPLTPPALARESLTNSSTMWEALLQQVVSEWKSLSHVWLFATPGTIAQQA